MPMLPTVLLDLPQVTEYLKQITLPIEVWTEAINSNSPDISRPASRWVDFWFLVSLLSSSLTQVLLLKLQVLVRPFHFKFIWIDFIVSIIAFKKFYQKSFKSKNHLFFINTDTKSVLEWLPRSARDVDNDFLSLWIIWSNFHVYFTTHYMYFCGISSRNKLQKKCV